MSALHCMCDGAVCRCALRGPVQIVNSQFIGNSAVRGGAIFASGATLSIVNSAFRGNTARTTGGATYTADSSSLTLLNSTFTGNTAGVMLSNVSMHA